MADVYKEADQLFDEYQFRNCHELLLKQTDRGFETLWRLCRVVYSLSRELVSDPGKAKQFAACILEGYGYAVRALETSPDASAAHKYYAIFLAEKSGIEGLRQRVLQLSTILGHLKRATELNPAEPFGWFLLGRFYYKLAELPWFQRKLIHTFTTDIPDATFADALQCFERAEQVAANFFALNHLLLGQAYLAVKDVKSAKHYLELAANQTAPRTADDLEAQREAKAILRTL
ncbi:regulator of microtubule dynamics protein 1-like [Anopheles bellator]|uniref:regulator of microtubule dynamics protein 1-like n=1 Tax=Anopheles bellator TaxID=139047 RepID=UPI00264803CB|nr:regulator of microtubule dynamics protein 1-like [Anopheles bellator]